MQITNFKKTSKEVPADPLIECTDLAKQQEKKDDRFLRQVGSAPEFFMFMASSRQLKDLEKFCTNNENFSVLGVDTTFNIGQYFVTITTYRHLMLETSKYVEPVMIGPILLHQRKNFESYFKLSSLMLQECPSLKHLKVFGTDGDVNLSNAFQVCFTDAKHLLCDIHMIDNIKNKLQQLNISTSIANQFVQDIFGKVSGDHKIPGLVDCMSESEFDKKLLSLKPEWKDRHSNGEKFLNYFQEYKEQLIKQCMSSEIRSTCRLGFPPKPYTQNGNECMNSVIKSDARYSSGKNINPYDFVKIVEKIVKRQENEIKFSVIGKGEYRLKEEYKHLQTDEDIYFKKSVKQREALFKKGLQKRWRDTIILHPGNTQRFLSEKLATDESETQSTYSSQLSVSPRESNIIDIPFRILCEIFQEAEEILHEESSIVPVPGQDGKAFSILDKSRQKDPRFVKYTESTKSLVCDAKCHRWNGYKFCGHVVALAEKLCILNDVVVKYKSRKTGINVTNISNTNMPAQRGKKGTKATQVRKGASNKRPSTVVDYVENVQNTELNQHDQVLPLQKATNAGQYFHVTFLAGIIKKCYGCGQEFSNRNRVPPNDIILKTFDHRIYISPKTKKTSFNMQNIYFHLQADCVRRRYPFFECKHVIIHEEMLDQLSSGHKAILKRMHMYKD